MQKNKKKNKKQKEEEEQVEEAPAEEEAAEEEEEVVIKSNKKASQNEESAGTVNVDEEKVNKAVKSIEEVSEELIEQFRTIAQKVLKKTKDDAAAPLAAALAVLTGANKVVTKSILTQREVSFFGPSTCLLVCWFACKRDVNAAFFNSLRASPHTSSPSTMTRFAESRLLSSSSKEYLAKRKETLPSVI